MGNMRRTGFPSSGAGAGGDDGDSGSGVGGGGGPLQRNLWMSLRKETGSARGKREK